MCVTVSYIVFHISSKINGIMHFFGCKFSKPSSTIGVQNLETTEKPLKAMVWGPVLSAGADNLHLSRYLHLFSLR